MTAEGVETPTTPDIHQAIAAIGLHLSTTDTGIKPKGRQLQLSSKNSNHWGARRADLAGVVREAERALFGIEISGSRREIITPAPDGRATGELGYVEPGDEGIESAFFYQGNFEVSHPFWSAFEPSLNLDEDWALLSGHMQRLYVELVTAVLAELDHRTTLLKMIAMKKAVTTISAAFHKESTGSRVRVMNRRYLVMQNWSSDRKASTKLIRDFLQENCSVNCTVKLEASGDSWTIKPAGRPAMTVHTSEYLAIDTSTDEIVSFDEMGLKRTLS